jgi:hypothetical protein
VNLVHQDHPEYRAFCRTQRARWANTRPRDPFAQEYHAQLIAWEYALRALLAQAFPAADERILMTQNSSASRARTRFFEIDFVAGTPEDPKLFVEIKLRERTVGSEGGWAQLRRSLQLARNRWPQLQGLNVCVAMGAVLGTENECRKPTVRLGELPRRLQAARTTDGEVVWLEGRDVAEFAIDHQLLTRDAIDQLPELRLDMLHPSRVLERRRPHDPPEPA